MNTRSRSPARKARVSKEGFNFFQKPLDNAARGKVMEGRQKAERELRALVGQADFETQVMIGGKPCDVFSVQSKKSVFPSTTLNTLESQFCKVRYSESGSDRRRLVYRYHSVYLKSSGITSPRFRLWCSMSLAAIMMVLLFLSAHDIWRVSQNQADKTLYKTVADL